MVEVASIAQAVGYREIDAELIEFQLSRATARDLPGVEPSMLADALARRAMEVEAIVMKRWSNFFRATIREHPSRRSVVWIAPGRAHLVFNHYKKCRHIERMRIETKHKDSTFSLASQANTFIS